jgi:hypothetical protein
MDLCFTCPLTLPVAANLTAYSEVFPITKLFNSSWRSRSLAGCLPSACLQETRKRRIELYETVTSKFYDCDVEGRKEGRENDE